MSERPLLILPPPEPSARPKAYGRASQFQLPGRARQTERFNPQFTRLRELLREPRGDVSLRADPSSIAPERAIVLEVAGGISDFYKAVQNIVGLEYLADEEIVFAADEDFAPLDAKGRERPERPVGGRLYLAMPDIGALNQLLSLWERYERGEPLGRGFTPWRNLFDRLKGFRPWGPQDRIPDETIMFWQERIGEAPAQPVRTEVELWFHEAPARRISAYEEFHSLVERAGGQIVDHSVIEEIGYEGALIDLPPSEIELLIARRAIRLAIADEIMFFRPQSTVSFPVEIEGVDEEATGAVIAPEEQPPPIVALFDGFPVQNHQLLVGRLRIDDPDGLEDMALVSRRAHGTAMASLILHGDRNRAEESLDRQIYVRPLMYAPADGDEQTLHDRLFIDTFYRAVLRMKEGDQEGEAASPEVFIVNLSLGDINRPFSGPISPWARLVDYLAHRCSILFLVSAGNIGSQLSLAAYSTWTEFDAAPPDEREERVLLALDDAKSERTVLSPPESLNALTVGSWHEDNIDARRPRPHAIDPFVDGDLPNISSALGLGHRRIVKPEIHFAGGCEQVTFQNTGQGLTIRPLSPQSFFGLRVAVPIQMAPLQRPD